MRFVLILLAARICMGATYYVDFATGADTNNGTAKGTPWKHAPKMQNCASNCNITPAAGDQIIFKGGVTWDLTCFGWLVPGSGTINNYIYYGVDQTWYSGGSWTRPKFDAAYSITQPEANAGNNSVVQLLSTNYVTLDNIEITGLMAKYSFGPALVGMYGGVFTLENMYLHGWDLISYSTTCSKSGTVISCTCSTSCTSNWITSGATCSGGNRFCVVQSGFSTAIYNTQRQEYNLATIPSATTYTYDCSPAPVSCSSGTVASNTGTVTLADDAHGGILGNNATPTVINCIVENSVLTGATYGHQNGVAVRGVGFISGTTVHDVSSNMLGVGGGVIHDNTMYNLSYTTSGDTHGNDGYDASYHFNGMYVNDNSTVYNNLMYSMSLPTNYYLEPCDSGNNGTITAFNNVAIQNSGNGASLFNLDAEGGTSVTGGACGTWNLYNNTMMVPDGSGLNVMIHTAHPGNLSNVTVINSHAITIIGYPTGCGSVSGTCVETTYTLESAATAANQGYVLGNFFAPTSGSNPTVGAGTNLTSLCTGAVAPLCSDKNGVPRPANGAWNTGAYYLPFALKSLGSANGLQSGNVLQ